MTDHTEDAILDDELDESDFNFDNEHEDALLAENEYDFLERPKCSEKNQKLDDEEVHKIEDEKSDQLGLEIEEDVLDIGIVDEDIVDQDTIYLQDSVTSSFNEKKCQEVPNNDKIRDSRKIDTRSNESKVKVTKKTGTMDDTVRCKFDQVDHKAIPVINNTREGLQKSHTIMKERTNDVNDRTTKPSAISLRKGVKKSYVDVPDLARVIESVQTVSTNSRTCKIKRPENYDRKRRDGTDESHPKYGHEERKRKDVPSHVQDHNENHDRDRNRDYDRERDHNHEKQRDHDCEKERDRDYERERERDRDHDRERGRNYEREHDRDHEKNRDYDRDRERGNSYERERDWNYDRDRDLSRNCERDYDRDQHNDYACGRPNYRQGYSTTEDDKLHIFPYNRLDEISKGMAFKYHEQSSQMQSARDFQSNFDDTVTQYHPGETTIRNVQIPQQCFDFHGKCPAAPPQILNHQSHTNAFGPVLNQHLYQRAPPPLQLFPNTARPPPQPQGNMRMQNIPHQQPMNVRPLHHQGFGSSMLQMNQRPQPHSQSLMSGRDPLVHVQLPQFGSSARPQLQPPQMIRPGAPPPQMRPPFNASVNVRPPLVGSPMDLMRPGSVPIERLPPPSILGRPPHQIVQMPLQRNQFPGNNGIRMGVPFRSNVPPPQNVPRSHAPSLGSVSYYDNRNQLPSTNPQILYQQPVGQTYINRSPISLPPPGISNQDQEIRNIYSNVQSNVDTSYSHYYSKQSPQRYVDDKGDLNPLKRNSSSIDESQSKLAIYDYFVGNKNEDEEMRQYRVKVEEQKKLREQLLQQKEEQRLKNQMQNFIQSNIKGILEKREQFRRKNEVESAKHLRESERKTKSLVKDNSTSRRDDAHSYSSSEYRGRRSISPSRPSETTVRFKNTTVRERVRVAVTQNARTNLQRTEKIKREKDIDLETDRGQLHKVLKITYKDGTVALKSIPVQGNNLSSKATTPMIRKNSSSSKLETNIGDEDPNNLNRRRMVVSKDVSIANVKNELNENIIVESVRKAVTKSSIPLAQRFSNLRATNKEDNDEFINEIKSKGRVVLPDEERSRTVWVKNIASSTNPALMQKIANTCGHVSKMNWINGGGKSPNQAKITFAKTEEAKKFCYNFNRKVVGVSMITVSIMSEIR